MTTKYFMPYCAEHHRFPSENGKYPYRGAFDVYCSLESGHEGEHVACWRHDPKRPVVAWEDPTVTMKELIELYKELS
jgi:hypothetical protein